MLKIKEYQHVKYEKFPTSEFSMLEPLHYTLISFADWAKFEPLFENFGV